MAALKPGAQGETALHPQRVQCNLEPGRRPLFSLWDSRGFQMKENEA